MIMRATQKKMMSKPVTSTLEGRNRSCSTVRAGQPSVENGTSADEYQVDLAPGLPAYADPADKWLENQAASGFFVGDFAGVVGESAGLVWDGWGYPRFSQEAVWAKAVTPELAAGKSMVDLLPAWEEAIKNEAQVNGYTVE